VIISHINIAGTFAKTELKTITATASFCGYATGSKAEVEQKIIVFIDFHDRSCDPSLFKRKEPVLLV